MEDLKAELSEFLKIHRELLSENGKNSFTALVAENWLEEWKRNGIEDGRACENPESAEKEKQKVGSTKQSTVLITVLENILHMSAPIRPKHKPGKQFQKCFISTLSLISKSNSEGLYKEAIRGNKNCYCACDEHVDDVLPAENTEGSNFHDVISKIHGFAVNGERVATTNEKPSNGQDFDNITLHQGDEDGPELETHSNLKSAVHVSTNGDRVFLISQPLTHTVQDALMYSPSLLVTKTNNPLFILYQILEFFKFFEEEFHLDLSCIHWDDIELDDRLWLKIHLPLEVYECSFGKSVKSDMLEETVEGDADTDIKQLMKLMDQWICGDLSNFDYLMFLNKLAGRSEKDPNHYPVVPWVSTLDTENASWRDLTKTKYRLNKGDDQLDLQFSMMRDSADTKSGFGGNNLCQVPHHIPEFLSEITYYVYMARITSKDLLCKLVRSYWEPNEYPASIQRMQVWTPDECVPEFYSDPSVFKSIHDDMADLAFPDWCESAEDFVTKHRAMLESDEVSKDLHHWIDLTFGYKLQGREAVDAKNVCLPLADNHTNLRNRGITQLFQVPHPKRRCKAMSQQTTDEIVDGDRQLAAAFDPLVELDELEKLLNFKVRTWNRVENTKTLTEALDTARNRLASQGQRECAMSDRNIAAFICLMVELHLPLQTRTKTRNITLGQRFKMCSDSFFLHKHVLPCGICYALEYFIENLRCSIEETATILSSSDISPNYASIFKTVSDRGLPPATPAILLSPYVHVLPFPVYFADLYETIDTILSHTHHYTRPLTDPALEIVTDKLKDLFEKLHDSCECLELITPHIQQLLRQPTPFAVQFLVSNFETVSRAMGPRAACEDILPLVLNIYSSTIQDSINRSSATSSKTNSKENITKTTGGGPSAMCCEDGCDAGPLEGTIGEKVEYPDTDVDDADEQRSELLKSNDGSPGLENEAKEKSSTTTETYTKIYTESFLLQLNTRLGVRVFLENFPRCVADALVSFEESETDDGIVECSERSICWMMQRVGPTLTSKYIVRPLFRVLNRCFLTENGSTSESSPHKRVLDCLVQAAALFGPSIITLQYLAQLSHSISSAVESSKFTLRNQAALRASVAAVTHFLTYIADATLMEQLSRLSKEIIIPIINQLARPDICFPGGSDSRKSLCLEVVHLMAFIVIRIGREMSRQHLTTLFQKFFRQFSDQPVSSSAVQPSMKQNESSDSLDIDAVVINHDIDTDAYKVGSTVVLDAPQEKRLHSSWFTVSPCPSPNKGNQLSKHLSTQSSDGPEVGSSPEQEITATFCPETAYCAYVSFTRLLGNFHMEKILGRDHDHIWKLSSQHEKSLRKDDPETSQSPPISSSLEKPAITMVGNRIIVASQTSQKPEGKTSLDDDFDIMTTLLTSSGGMQTEDHLEESVRRTLQVNPSSQLTENWLAYWEHEIGLPETDRHIHFNQIELQRFTGHASSVRCLCPEQSEEWFLSGGKDKTVKIWSLCRNHENEKDAPVASASPIFTYKGHKKTVNYVGIVEAERFVVSNDGNFHAWDPYTGQQVLSFDSADVKSGVAVAATVPSPHRIALVVTNETNLRIVDFRRKSLAQEFKTTAGTSVGIVRAMCAASDGQWVAMGYSSGVVTILDVRVGTLLSMRQAHEADILAMHTASATRFLTTSADQSVMLWEVGISYPLAVYKSYQEPVTSVETFNDEIIAASVANRVTVHAMPSESFGEGNGDTRSLYDKPVAVSKLRSDSFRGVLTTFSVLPMKRQLLIASDNGNIKLMA